MAESKEEKARKEAGVASEEANAKLKHSEGGATTRDDALDAGVPMKQGDPSEPVGPEDAFGKGKKRGDYRGRGDGQEHFESVPTENAGEPVTRKTEDADGNEVEVVVDSAPVSQLEPQTPRVADIGDEKGEKGGVTTSD